MTAVTVSRLAQNAVLMLSEDDRQRVVSFLDHLRNWENDKSLRSLSHRMDVGDDISVLQTTTDIRIVFRQHDDNSIEVLDILRYALPRTVD